ncbi:alpha/beta hydrolase [Undibacterium sp.]|jgi:dienelactone hydrolase|uniref:alpha/beta hydrolase family protein n=1 Tax=Undibacterium sp. TaxID=1914977 RepID=UPI002C49AE70|nr:alpha/beta hydrolase [Undibacterium sp.]HTD05580.1 alpha/beta hydrolase [Undibacterium sp.]
MSLKSILALTLLLLSPVALAERLTEEALVTIQGEQRHYFRVHDTNPQHTGPVILLISGSGCADFGSRFPSFFEKYPAPLDVYFLEKPAVKIGDEDGKCSAAYKQADYLERRVSDNLEFLETQPLLKERGKHSVAIVGFSEGGAIAPLIASQSDKIGWLATAGSGGMRQSDEFLYFADHGVEPYAKPFSREYFLQEYAKIKKDPGNLYKDFFGKSYRYWSSHLFRDPIAAYSKLDIPIVAAMGENDDSVPLESGKALQRYFQAHPDKNFQFIVYPKASHALRTPEKNGAQTFAANLAKWFKGDANAFAEQ